ncbi:MAG TPA: glycosyltransferase family 1 protein [Gaiellaceae bacterium]|nr:glycosyltransferase family 1 protein [Gaiellaceae bacterium]
MRVTMDVTPLAQTTAGTSRYINGLLRELRRRDDVSIRTRSFGGRARAWNLPRDAVWYPFVLGGATSDTDVLHCPTYRGPVVTRCAVVVTVHDLAIFRRPDAFHRWSRWYSPAVVPRVLRAARMIIAVSQFTKRELVDVLCVQPEKIAVIPNAVDDAFGPEGPAAEGDYVLAVGTIEPRKNLGRVAEAARRVGLELRVVGARGWGDVSVSGNGVRWLGDVRDEELARLYRGARCVAYPSLYEGFGIPVVEAMACGTPVVTSRGGATEEVADGAAVLVDPLDPVAIAVGIERALAERDDLSRRGLERARRFTWSAVAESTVEVYREAAA